MDGRDYSENKCWGPSKRVIGGNIGIHGHHIGIYR